MLWYIYTTEYYLSIREDKIIQFSATWVNLESIMLSEVRQMETDRHKLISLSLMWHAMKQIRGYKVNRNQDFVFSRKLVSLHREGTDA